MFMIGGSEDKCFKVVGTCKYENKPTVLAKIVGREDDEYFLCDDCLKWFEKNYKMTYTYLNFNPSANMICLKRIEVKD